MDKEPGSITPYDLRDLELRTMAEHAQLQAAEAAIKQRLADYERGFREGFKAGLAEAKATGTSP